MSNRWVQLTESPQLEQALADARQRHSPRVSDSDLIAILVIEGSKAIAARDLAELERRRLVRSLADKYTDLYADISSSDAHEEWPA